MTKHRPIARQKKMRDRLCTIKAAAPAAGAAGLPASGIEDHPIGRSRPVGCLGAAQAYRGRLAAAGLTGFVPARLVVGQVCSGHPAAADRASVDRLARFAASVHLPSDVLQLF